MLLLQTKFLLGKTPYQDRKTAVNYDCFPLFCCRYILVTSNYNNWNLHDIVIVFVSTFVLLLLWLTQKRSHCHYLIRK